MFQRIYSLFQQQTVNPQWVSWYYDWWKLGRKLQIVFDLFLILLYFSPFPDTVEQFIWHCKMLIVSELFRFIVLNSLLLYMYGISSKVEMFSVLSYCIWVIVRQWWEYSQTHRFSMKVIVKHWIYLSCCRRWLTLTYKSNIIPVICTVINGSWWDWHGILMFCNNKEWVEGTMQNSRGEGRHFQMDF